MAGAILAVGSSGSMLLTMAYAVAPAGASTPARMAVPQGITPASVGAARVAAVSSGAKETVSFVLQERNVAALDAQIEAGMPHGFLSVAQFAARYGQPAAQVRALESYLSRYGIKSSADADGLDVTGTGSVGQFGRALSVTQAEYRTSAVPASDGQAARAAVTFRAAQGTPQLPSALAAVVQSVQGLDTYPVFTSNAVHTSAESRSATAGGGRERRAAKEDLTPGNFAKQYGLTSLYAKGAKGQGQTMGIVTFAAFRTSDVTHFWSKVIKLKTKANRIKIVKIGAGSPFSIAADSQRDHARRRAVRRGRTAGQHPRLRGAQHRRRRHRRLRQGGEPEQGRHRLVQLGPVRDGGAGRGQELADGRSTRTTSSSASWRRRASPRSPHRATRALTPASMDLGSTNLSVQSTSDSPWTTAAGGTTLAGTIPLGSTGVVIKASGPGARTGCGRTTGSSRRRQAVHQGGAVRS